MSLIFWWRKHIRVNYQQTINQRNSKIIECRLQSYEEEKQELIKQNAELAKIIHRDNKLIPAMTLAVEELISKSDYKAELMKLKNQLEELSKEHGALVNSYTNLSDNLPKTGALSVDAVLHFLYSKALRQKTACAVCAEENSFPLLFERVPEQTDLNTVILDLGENAILSASNAENGKVKISFDIYEDCPRVNVFDNGAPFDEKVVANLGKRKITTRQTEGGSGVGLMTLFEILRRYGGSFILDERRTDDGFTKCVTLAFDGKGNTTVISDNAEYTSPLPKSEDPNFK